MISDLQGRLCQNIYLQIKVESYFIVISTGLGKEIILCFRMVYMTLKKSSDVLIRSYWSLHVNVARDNMQMP